MSALVDVLKRSMHLGTITFVLILLAVGLIVVAATRSRRWSLLYFGSAFFGLWAVSTPAVAERLAATVDSGFTPIVRVEDARGADTVVVLGGGSWTYRYGQSVVKEPTRAAIFRLMEAARLFRLLGQPTVIVSGGVTSRDPGAAAESEALRDMALRVGIPADRIVLESVSHNTRDEAVEIKRMLGARARAPFVLVTQPTHIRRAMAAFRSVGLEPVPSPAPEKSAGDWEHGRWLPDNVALELSDNVFYEWFALGYYWQQGWLPR
jgi:uncharacterized SAM-binding protein YcdF (DUF218 family)